MKLELSNGMFVEGSPAQIEEFLRHNPALRPAGPMYHSETHGFIPIKDMDTNHIRNALLKLYKEWINELYRIANPLELSTTIVNGPGEEGSEFHHLLAELSRRRE